MKIQGIDDDFLREMENIVAESNMLLVERGEQYNQGGVTLHDQYRTGTKRSSIRAYWTVLHIRFFRLKSMMEGGGQEWELISETLRDLVNEARFLYASIKCNK